MASNGHLFCFGLGYTGKRFADILLRRGWTVSGTTRSQETSDLLRKKGINPYLFDGHDLHVPKHVLKTVTHVIGSIPPGPAGDPSLLVHGEKLRNAEALIWAGYLSTPAVYGDRGGALVDENAEVRPGSARGKRRLVAEMAWIQTFAGTKVQANIFRLSGIYGPGRNAAEQLLAGTARIVHKPGQVFNRIHVDDICTILLASMAGRSPGGVYNVADDEACPSGDVVRYAAEILGLPAPEPVEFGTADLSPMARSFYSECKRLDTTRMKERLGIELAYPTYREGLDAIVADLRTPCSSVASGKIRGL
jgi:nucleoside-diphosphate-sugar epimerase